MFRKLVSRMSVAEFKNVMEIEIMFDQINIMWKVREWLLLKNSVRQGAMLTVTFCNFVNAPKKSTTCQWKAYTTGPQK